MPSDAPPESVSRDRPTIPGKSKRIQGDKRGPSLTELVDDIHRSSRAQESDEERKRRHLRKEYESAAEYFQRALLFVRELGRDPFKDYEEEKRAVYSEGELFPSIRKAMDKEYVLGTKKLYEKILHLLDDPVLKRMGLSVPSEVFPFPTEANDRNWQDARWRANQALRFLILHAPEIFTYLHGLDERRRRFSGDTQALDEEEEKREEQEILLLVQAANAYEESVMKHGSDRNEDALNELEDQRMKLFQRIYPFLFKMKKRCSLLSYSLRKNSSLEA